MKIKIIRGTNKIGGCITEISTKKSKIIIDFGEELSDDLRKKDEIDVEGLTCGIPSYDGVFITHSHSDHIGLIDRIMTGIPVYVEKESQIIYEVSNDFSYKKSKKDNKIVRFKKPISINNGDIVVTYYRIDHSAFNSAVLLIEVEGKRILHTGDFRRNGYKGKWFESTLKEIGQVDYLITEGTCLNRDDIQNKTEYDLLKKELNPIFAQYKQIFVLQSSTNIDRIVTMFKAAKRANKKFVEDICTANITMRLDKRHRIPSVIFKENTPFVWESHNRKYTQEMIDKYITPLKPYMKSNIFHSKDGYCMLIKASMYNDIKMLCDKGLAKNACLIYSMWSGYKDKPKMDLFLKKIEKLGIHYKEVHTSGHADLDTLKLMHKLTNPREKTIVIHTENKEKAKEIFDNYKLLEDKQEIKI